MKQTLFQNPLTEQYDGGSCPSVRTKEEHLRQIGHDESITSPRAGSKVVTIKLWVTWSEHRRSRATPSVLQAASALPALAKPGPLRKQTKKTSAHTARRCVLLRSNRARTILLVSPRARLELRRRGAVRGPRITNSFLWIARRHAVEHNHAEARRRPHPLLDRRRHQ